MTTHPAFLARMLSGARNYAEANKSDPFCLAVAMSQIRNGICGIHPETGAAAYYDAKPVQDERRLPPGMTFSDGRTTYQATAWRSMVRP